MKKALFLVVALIMALCMLAACAAPATPEAEADKPAEAPVEKPADDKAEADAPAQSGGAKEPKNGDKYEIAMIVKAEGLQWFDCMLEGMRRFESEHDDVVCHFAGPEGADAAKQVSIIEDYIAKDVDALVIVAIDPDALVSVVRKAKDAGITVIINEGETLAGIADLDVEGAYFTDRGVEMAEAFAQAMGGKGNYVGCVGALTMITHMDMYNAGVEYLKANYPEMTLLEEEPYEAGIDAQQGYEQFKEIANAFPELNGYFSCTTEGTLGACRYLEETNNRNIVVGGGGTPQATKDYIMNDWLVFSCSSNPIEQGYACVSACYKVLKGEEIYDGMSLDCPYFTECYYDAEINKVVGKGTVIYTKENVADFNY